VQAVGLWFEITTRWFARGERGGAGLGPGWHAPADGERMTINAVA
jgi:hypothetical protein